MTAAKGFTPELKADVINLHKKYNFSEDEYDVFKLNNQGQWDADQLLAFKDFLEKEDARKQKVAARSGPSGDGKKRKPALLGAGLNSIMQHQLNLALGRTAAVARTAETHTPYPKRLRDVRDDLAGTPARGTPDPPPKPMRISLMKSVNEGNLEKPAPTDRPVKLEVLGDSMLWTGKRRGAYSWMDESLEERATHRDAQLVAMEAAVVAAMRERHQSADQEEELLTGTVGVPTQSEAVLCGRVVCEGLEGRLNERSILLEGSRASSMGARVQLSVQGCPHVAAFPGQIVGVVGRSGMAGTTFHARDFLPGLPLPAPPAEGSSGAAPQQQEALHALVLAGPYCLRDGLDFTPLEQALEHAVRERPQVLVLVGPFLDAGNQKVSSGDTTLPGEDDPVSFEELYAQHLLPLLERGLAPLRGGARPTEVLLVPSLEEVLCFHPLPQPPLDVSLAPVLQGTADGPRNLERLRKLGVQFLPNPAHVRINGVQVSITSADALSPLLRELVLRPEGKKIEEALRLLLYQRSLLPVVPRDPPQVSEIRSAAFQFPDQDRLPEVCIFPSAMGFHGSVVENTVFVNPGSLCRPAALGSFAELWLAPPKRHGSLRERARVDIQKVNETPK
jgi:DNA polymerase alpha subunit B